MKILISTGALIGLANGLDYHLLKTITPKLHCDGLEFIMYSCWYDEVDEVIEVLKNLQVDIPIMHFDKKIGEHIAYGDLEKAFKCFEINCRMANEIGAKKAVIHLWNGTISDQKIELNIDAYGLLRKISDSYGIEILVENVVCNKYNPFCNWNWLIEKYPDVSYIFDTKMAAFHAQLDGLYTFDKVHHIKHYHINDYAGEYMDWEVLLKGIVPLGKGKIDFNRFFQFLVESGYDDTLTLEASGVNKETGMIDYNMLNNQVSEVKRFLKLHN